LNADEEFYSQQALRVRDLAGKADLFTRRRLLDLAARYAKGPLRRRRRPSSGRCRFPGAAPGYGPSGAT
jgi:hypothetical protein